MKIIRMQECGSTNSELAKLTNAEGGTVVVADCQMAGRGQRGNTWEAEPGKNLTFSLLLRPYSISAAHQFELSMIVSLGICQALDRLLPDGKKTRIKWPNDIYVDNRKLVGILIENTLDGLAIERSIVGVGINVNQTEFRSDAPNPVSLKQLTGQTYNLDSLLAEVVTAITDMLDQYENDPEPDELQYLYTTSLWRGDGALYPWVDTATGTRFEARIDNVDTDGTLHLTLADGTTRSYLFKQVQAEL